MALLESLREKYSRKKILVVGLGNQGGGVGIARFFAELGSQVVVSDKKTEKELETSIRLLANYKNIKFSLGGHRLEDFLNCDVIFKGPSVPWSLSLIVEAQRRGVPIEMEMAFVSEHFPGKIIGVTGTRGKSTTTYLIFNLLKMMGFKVLLGGGFPGVSTIEFLKTADSQTWLVAELSSWALSGFHRRKISPNLAVFTNFYPDHLDYYKNMEDYLFDKKAIYLYQKTTEFLVANRALEPLITERKTGVFWFSKKDYPLRLKNLQGDHNLENAAAAFKVAEVLELPRSKAIEIISKIKGLPYRQEIIHKQGSMIFVNDATSTTPTATIKAIERFKDKKIILILGGNSKNLPVDDLLKHLEKVKKIVLLKGSFTEEILPKLRAHMPEKISREVYDDLELAIQEALQIASEEKTSLSVNNQNQFAFCFRQGQLHSRCFAMSSIEVRCFTGW